MRTRPLFLSAALIAGTIAAGLALRLVPLGLPQAVVKYGGSTLWASMIYWIVSSGTRRIVRAALIAGAVAATVELFKLVHAPALDAFRLTLTGSLLLGRVFAAADLLAYAAAIGLTAAADRMLRRR